MDFPLDTINSNITKDICAKQCGAKCCDFYLNDFHVRIFPLNFNKFNDYDLDQFIVWDHGPYPRIASKPGGECIFLDPKNKECVIYPIRPQDCRDFPFAKKHKSIPNHCILYHNSSSDLKNEEKLKLNQSNIKQDITPSNDIYQRYYNNLEKRKSIDLDELFNQEKILEAENQFISIIYNNPDVISKAEQTIDSYMEELENLSYVILSFLLMNQDFEFVCHINGIIRKDENVDIPIISKFPPDIEEYNKLHEWVNHNSYYNLLGGILMPDNNYKTIRNKFPDHFNS